MNALNILISVILGVTITVLGSIRVYEYAVQAHGFGGATQVRLRTLVVSQRNDTLWIGVLSVPPSSNFRRTLLEAGISLNYFDWVALISNFTGRCNVNPFPAYDINTLNGAPFLVRAAVYLEYCEGFICATPANIRIGPY